MLYYPQYAPTMQPFSQITAYGFSMQFHRVIVTVMHSNTDDSCKQESNYLKSVRHFGIYVPIYRTIFLKIITIPVMLVTDGLTTTTKISYFAVRPLLSPREARCAGAEV